MLKIAFFLIFALVAVQGFQARSVEPNERALTDIINKIKEAIEKIRKIIHDLATQIPWVINHIKEKVTEILVKIPNLIKDINQKANEIIDKNGEAGSKCVAAHRGELDALVENGRAGIKACLPEALTNFDDLKVHINALIAKAQDLSDDIIQRALKCVKDNKPNPLALAKCLRDQVDAVKEEVQALENDFKAIVAEGQEAAKAARITLTTCINKVEADLAAKEQAIFDDINACVNA